MRLFIALELSGEQKDEVISLQDKLKSYLDGVRWVKPAGMHLTLKFLGDTEPQKVEQVKEAMDNAVLDLESFEVSYGRGGIFPSPAKAKVIWLGLNDGEDNVIKLAQKVERALQDYGFAPDKREFTPHLTIGRIKKRIPKNIIEQFIDQEKTFQTAKFKIEEVVLFESQLTPQGAIHTPLHQSRL
ncbi:MAG: RNA 2',3'-cyclic phosphodiesterase [Bacillota bacterium]